MCGLVTGAFRQPKFECGSCEMLVFRVFRVCGARQNFYMFSLNCNPDLDDCLLPAMAAVQATDVHASFLFVGELNGHHQEWLGSTTTNVMMLRPSILPRYQVVINR